MAAGNVLAKNKAMEAASSRTGTLRTDCGITDWYAKLAVAITAAMMQTLSPIWAGRERVFLFQIPCATAATHPTMSASDGVRRSMLMRITGRFAENDIPPLTPRIWTKLQTTARLRYTRKSLGSGQYQLAIADAR